MSRTWAQRLQTVTSQYIAKGQVSNNVREICEKYVQKVSAPFPARHLIQAEKKVYANNFVDLSNVRVIGFDLDYTLVTYTDELQSFIYDEAKSLLISKYGFPTSLKEARFEKSFAIRGLSIDAKNGVLVKLSHLQTVGANYAYRGKIPLPPAEIEQLYGEYRHVSYDDLSQMRPLHDMYSMAEGCLIADAVGHFDRIKLRTGEDYSPLALVTDVQSAIREVHVSGILHRAVVNDPERFIHPSPTLGNLLDHYARGGKKFFLCTNSGFDYANRALSHVLKLPFHRDGSGWRDIFDVIICSANKPNFYFGDAPFREWDVERGSTSVRHVRSLDRGMVYTQGSASALKDAKGWVGKDVLYLGDNLRADLQEARRCLGWYTGCIIHEVEHEVCVQSSPKFQELYFLRSLTRALITELQETLEMERQAAERGVLASTAANHASEQHLSHSQPLLSATSALFHLKNQNVTSSKFDFDDAVFINSVRSELEAINAELSSCFSRYFGGIFRTDGHLSLFALTVRRYCDFYTSDVCNLLRYNTDHQFFPSNAIHMAHDTSTRANLSN